MNGAVLIVTPSMGFGELIRQAMEEAGAFRVVLDTSGAEALQDAQNEDFDLCILDADIVDMSLPELWGQLQQLHPKLRLLIIFPEAELDERVLGALSPAGVLKKPFYMPNLLSTVERVLGGHVREEPAVLLPERSDPSAGFPPPWLQDVDRAAQYLTRLTLESAAQAALITRFDRLWAYAGELPQPAAEELASAVSDYWANDGETDLARFVRLEATGGEHMLYATGLPGDLVLALVFDARTPFSEIRTQASSLARALETHPNDDLAPVDQALPSLPNDKPEGRGETGSAPRVEPLPVPPFTDAQSSSTDWVPPELDMTQEPIDPRLAEQPAEMLFLDPVSPAVHRLTYACVLLPRLPDHQLRGDLAEQLEIWIPQICLASGWRLTTLVLQAEYLVWILQLSPADTPQYMMDVFREETSRRIFTHFPRLAEENHSGDFWAPGFMIVSRDRPPPPETVVGFIRRTRTWQGYQPLRPEQEPGPSDQPEQPNEGH